MSSNIAIASESLGRLARSCSTIAWASAVSGSSGGFGSDFSAGLGSDLSAGFGSDVGSSAKTPSVTKTQVAHANNAKQQTQAFQLIMGPLNDIGEMPETKRLGPAAALANGNLIMIPDGEVQVSMMQPSNPIRTAELSTARRCDVSNRDTTQMGPGIGYDRERHQAET
jgi:hypothetical protein